MLCQHSQEEEQGYRAESLSAYLRLRTGLPKLALFQGLHLQRCAFLWELQIDYWTPMELGVEAWEAL